MASAKAKQWTCERCEVTVSWMPGVEAPELPPNWSDAAGVLHCLGCRREIAGDEGVDALSDDCTPDDRRRRHIDSRIEFEISLEPDRPDQHIAKVCHTSIVAVRRTRDRLGLKRVDAATRGS